MKLTPEQQIKAFLSTPEAIHGDSRITKAIVSQIRAEKVEYDPITNLLGLVDKSIKV